MPVNSEERSLVESMFKAMQMGPEGEELMVGLFAADGELTEPFSGKPQTHKGTEGIRAFFKSATTDTPPDMKIVMDRLDRDGERVRADWTCTSPAFPKPMRGHDLYTIRDGKIVRVEIVVTDMPPMGP
ncbi:MAG: nuclear transport factor 2 family protein [Phycisphaerae bacterium]